MYILDDFTPRVLTGIINLRPKSEGLFSHFFKRKSPSDVEIFELETVVNGVSVLPTISSYDGGTQRNNKNRQLSSVKAPRFRPKRSFSPADVLKTQTGSNPYNRVVDPVEKAVADDMDAHIADIEYSTNVMCSQALVHGKIELFDMEGQDKIKTFSIDYHRPADHEVHLSGDELWSNAEAHLFNQSIQFNTLIQKATGGFSATDVILGKTALSHFLRAHDVEKVLDNRNFEAGTLSPKVKSAYLGKWNGMDIWYSAGEYIDIDGQSQAYIPATDALFVARECAHEIEYGLPMDEKCGGATEIFSKKWVQEDPSGVFTIAESRPCPMVKHAGSTVKVTVCA